MKDFETPFSVRLKRHHETEIRIAGWEVFITTASLPSRLAKV
jgi:hypothetical protein